MIVRGDREAHPGPGQPVVVGIDGSAPASAALAFAAVTADEASAPLTILCAWNALAEDAWVDAYAGRGWGRGP